MRSGAPYVLAIDLGTTGVKVAVVDGDAAIRSAAAESFPTKFTSEGAAEQDAEGWWQAIGRCARAAVAGAGDADAIAAVAVTAQYMSVVAIDELGVPLAPVVTWMDTRGGGRHPLRDDRDAFGLWSERHGLPPLPNDDLAHIAVLRAFYPEIAGRVAAFVEPVDALVARLSGRIVATATTAFPLMCTDNREWSRVAYDPELLARAGVDARLLPPIVAGDEPVGSITTAAAEHLGVTGGALVLPGTVDSITSAIGGGALEASRVALVVGTTSVIASHVDAKAADLAHGIASIPSPLPQRYFVMAENGVGGRALEAWLHQVVFADDGLATGVVPEDAFARAEAVASAAALGAGGVMYLPWLAGSGAPAPDDYARGGFVGLGLASTRADMTRAVYEGVALNAAWLLGPFGAFTGIDYREITFGGGGARSALWGGILADALGITVHRLAEPQYTNARGTALLAFAVLGRADLASVGERIRIAETYRPDADRAARYATLLERFAGFHAATRSWFRTAHS
ncbi:MAG: xylulokinase [Actinomycetota bacterium]|nr:xylulokinase [Actinomycetota bacterium]